MGHPATADPCTVIAPQLLRDSLATILGVINGFIEQFHILWLICVCLVKSIS